MSHARRTPSRRSSTWRTRRRNSPQIKRRLLQTEQLEIRTVMDGAAAAAIVNPFHNAWYPADVNADYSVTPLDALIIINELNASGPRQLGVGGTPGATGEQSSSPLIDVDGDGYLNPLDALLVINHLNAEAEGPAVVSYQLQVVGADGQPLPQVDGRYQVQKGQNFGVRVSVKDNRPINTIPQYNQTPYGVSTTYADLHFNPLFAELGAPNIQQIQLGGFGGSSQGTAELVISIPGFADTDPIIVDRRATRRSDNYTAIQEALDNRLGVGNSHVQNNGNNDNYTIVFTGDLTNAQFDMGVSITKLTGTGFTPTASVVDIFDPAGLNLTNRNDMIAAMNYGLYWNPDEFTFYKQLYGALTESDTSPRTFEVLQKPANDQWVISTFGGSSLAVGGDIGLQLDPNKPNFDDETDYMPRKSDLPNGYFTIASPYFTALEAGTSQFSISPPGDDLNPNSVSTTLLAAGEIPSGTTSEEVTKVSWMNISMPSPVIIEVVADVTANNDSVTILQDASETVINVLANDTSNVTPALDLTVTGVVSAGNQGPVATGKGSVRIDGGQVKYTPNQYAFGQDTFTYFVSDGVNGSASATVTVNITDVNDPPVAVDDGPLTTPEDVTLSIPLADLLANDHSDVDAGNGEMLRILTTPGAAVNGTVVYNPATLSFEFTPAQDFHGSASFEYTLSDNGTPELTDTGTVSITVTPRNDPPTISDPANQVINESAGPQSQSNFISVTSFGPPDESGQMLDAYLVTVVNTTGATLPMGTTFFSSLPTVGTDGTLTYTVTPNVWGVATVEVRARDNGGTANGGQDTSAPKTFTITVNNVNDAPTFTLGPDQTVAEGAALTTLPGFVSNVGPGLLDPAQTVTVSVTNVAADSTLTFSTPPTITNGTLTFQADTHAFGTAIVTVTAKDDGGTDNGGEDTTIKTFTITVNEGNDPPTANPDFASIPDGSVNFEVDVLGNDSSGPDVGAPGEMLMIQSVDTTGLPPEVRITNAGDKLLVSTDPLYFNKPDIEVPYTIVDRATGGLTASSTVTLSFIPNKLPLAVDDTISQDQNNNLILEDQSGIILNPLVNDRSVEFNVGDLRITGISLTELPVDSGSWLTSITDTGNLSINIVSDGTTDDTRISFTPAQDFFGNFTFYYRIDDVVNMGEPDYEGPDVGKITVVVAPVNDVPSFVLDSVEDQDWIEDDDVPPFTEFVASASPGPANESNQTLSYLVSNNNNDLFEEQPAISPGGTLTYKLKEDAFGSAIVTVRVKDSGGTANGGVDTSAPQTFAINVAPQNDAPTFDLPELPNQEVLEVDLAGQAARTVAGFATNISTGAANEDQTLNFIVTTNNDALFTSLPQIDPVTGNLTYTQQLDVSGTATITVKLMDDGGTDNGGQDTSAPQTFTITVLEVNDKPSFTLDTLEPIDEDDPAQSFPGFAQAYAGSPNEATQTFTYEIQSVVLSGTNPNVPGLFAVAPAIDPSGTLTFTPLADAFGTATVTVRVKDSGGTANGGIDTSDSQTFTITILPVNDPPPAVDDGPYQVFQSGGPALYDVLANDAPNVDPGETLTIADAVITSPASFPAGTAPTVEVTPDGLHLRFTPNPDGYLGIVEVTYTVSDGHGGTNTAVATFNIRDYIPGNISGVVWADVDNDAQIDLIDPPMGPERRLADVEVYITGTTIFEETFSDMVVTNEFGEYSFTGLVPGTYTISLKNPTPGSTLDTVELFIDGKDVADVDGDYVNDVDATNGFYETEDKSASVRRTGNNTFEVKFGEDGLDVSRLNFGMLGLQAKFVNIRDHLASSTSNGVVFGANKSLAADSQQYWFALYDGWDGMHSLSITLASDLSTATIKAQDAAGTLHTKTLSFTNDWMKIRIMGRDGDNTVVRLVGAVHDFFPEADQTPPGGEPLAAAGEPGMYAEGEGADYAAAADEVFAGEAWA